MLVGELLQELKAGRTIREIAAGLEVNPSTLQRKLRRVGYEYDNSAKVWRWAGEGEEPRQVNLLEATTVKVPKKNEVTTKSVIDGNETTTARQHIDNKVTLSAQEIEILKSMIATYQAQGSPQKPQERSGTIKPLHELLLELPREDKSRLNVFLGTTAASRLEEFAKNQRMNKSDVIEIALNVLLEQYDA